VLSTPKGNDSASLLIIGSPESIAEFFYKTPNLSKENLGEYFGEHHEFNIKVVLMIIAY
jgi:Sec7 domain.